LTTTHSDGDDDGEEEGSDESLDGLLGTELDKLVTTEEHAYEERESAGAQPSKSR